MKRILSWLCVTFAPILAATAADGPPRPTDFAIIFNLGYAGDHFPAEPEAFEKLVLACKAAHYNVLLTKYTPEREKICKKHGMKLMVDLLVGGHHVYKDVEGAKALCESLRDSDTIYAYHLWSDRVGGTVAGRSRDIKNVHSWDPKHPAYVGDYKASAIGGLVNPGIIGYYDFHWKRLGHFRHMQRAWDASKKTGAPWLKYADGAPGRVGAGNYNRVLYTISTSIAFGLKGYMYHYAGGLNKSTWTWEGLGLDQQRVNAEIAPLGPELMKIGIPTAVHSTPITKTAKDRPTDQEQPAVPAGLTAIPADFPLQVAKGEVIVGAFKSGKDGEAWVFANHNSYQPQAMEVTFAKPPAAVEHFDRAGKTWKKLELDNGRVKFEVPPAACELLRAGR